MISSFGQLRGPPYCLQKEKKSLHFFLCGNFHTVFYFILCISLPTFSCPRTQAITRNVQLKLSLMFTSTIVFKIRWGAQVTPLSYCGQPVISRLQSTSAPLDNSFLVTERLFSSQVSIYDIWILHIDALPSYKNGKLTLRCWWSEMGPVDRLTKTRKTGWNTEQLQLLSEKYVDTCVFSAMSMWPVF